MKKPKIENLTDGKYYGVRMSVRDGHLLQVTHHETPYGYKLSDYIDSLKVYLDKLVDPHIELITEYDSTNVVIFGWREMTEPELKKAESLRSITQELTKEDAAKREQWERQQYENLKAKFDK